MKHLLHRLRHVLGLLLLSAPLAWAVTFSGLGTQIVKQLSFDTLSLQPAGPAGQITRSVGDGPYTLAARSPYSKGAITYSSSAPGVASVDPATGRVTPLSVGKTTLIASQAALAPYPATTAQYSLELTGTQVVYAPWSLSARTFGDAPFELSATPPTSTPAHPAPIVYSTTTPGVVSVSASGTVTLKGVGTATVVATQAAQGNFGAGTVSANFNVGAATPTLSWSAQSLRLGGPDLTLTSPTTNNTDPAATFSYTVADATIAQIVNGNQVRALKAGTTTLTATQAAAGNYLGGSVTASLTVQPAQVTLSGLADITRTIDPTTPANNTVTLAANVVVPGGSGTPVITYTSSDNAVATVNGNVLTLVGPGRATLTANLAADTTHTAASVQVMLQVRTVPTVTLTAINKPFGVAPFPIGVTTASTGTRTYTVTDGTVASVDASGQMTLLKVGSTSLKVDVAANGNYAPASATTTVTVTAADPGLSLTLGPKYVGDAAFTPTTSSSSTGAFTFEVISGAGTVANVVNGQVVPVAPGTARIRVTQAASGNYAAATAEADLTVLAAVTNAPTLTLSMDPKTFGDADFTPVVTSSSTGTRRFSSSNTAVATIDSASGLVHIVGAGSTTITVAVDAKAPSGTVLNFSTPLTVPFSTQVITPSISTSSTAPVVLSSESQGIATISADGRSIEPKAPGTVTIFVTQDATATHLGYSGQFTLDMKAGTPAATPAWPPCLPTASPCTSPTWVRPPCRPCRAPPWWRPPFSRSIRPTRSST